MGVLDDDHIPGHLGETGAQGRALPLVALMVKGLDIVMVLDQPGQDFPGAILGGVIHCDDLFVVRRRLDQAKDLLQGGFLVVNRDNDAQLHAGCSQVFMVSLYMLIPVYQGKR